MLTAVIIFITLQLLFSTNLGCDIRSELTVIKEAIYRTFVFGKQQPIYDPDQFRNFCFTSGAPTLFDTILAAVTSSRHSQNRINLNQKRVVSFIYNMCFCLSQQCNVMQVDHALYLHSNRINQEGIGTENRMGNTCCRKTMDSTLNTLATQSLQQLNSFVLEAMRNKWLLVLIIDDYTNIHTHRRPKGNKASNAVSMCTIIIKAFKTINAIGLPSSLTSLHNEQGVDIDSCKQLICSGNQLFRIANTYASTMPEWMTTQFFQPESERQRLSIHEYCESTSVRTMRRMTDLHLVDFVELQLKSKENFKEAFDIVLNTNLKLYMQNFVLIQPGDWPSQFFSRQLVYEHLINYTNEQQQNMAINTLLPPLLSQSTSSVPPMTAIVPLMGPLHISLNSREHILLSFHPFFKSAYKHLFPSSKLPEKPKPWCTSLLLEVIYGGWTLIRDTTREVLGQCKDLQYGTLLNLLDNYIPLVLSIYPISFKSNRFQEYFKGIIRMWVMFTCLKRKHYNKATLVWIANILHWKKSFPDLYNFFRNWVTTTDEYPVENTHSIIRAQTKHSDTASLLTRKVKSIFMSKDKQMNFRSGFTPPKHFSFSHGQLKYLKVKCSQFIGNILCEIKSNPSNSSFRFTKSKKERKLTVTMPEVFGKKQMPEIVLPLGYHGERPPDEEMKCDLESCKVKAGKWSILQGCWHSFHDECLEGCSHCPLCEKLLKQKIEELGKVAKEAILNNNPTATIDTQDMPDIDDEEENDDDGSSNVVPNVDEQKMEESIALINRTINNLNDQPSEYTPSESTIPHMQPLTYTKTSFKKASTTKNCQTSHKDTSCSDNYFLQVEGTTVLKYNHPGVIEWVLPNRLSQSQILGQFLGSNACTVISILGALKLASGNMTFPTENGLSTAINSFATTMKEGNFLYQEFDIDPHQPNLEVRDAVERFRLLNYRIQITEDVGFFSTEEFYSKLEKLCKYQREFTGILIVPPDKSMLIFMKDGKLSLMDSHEHGSNGAIIATSSISNLSNFVEYLSGMVDYYWHTSLAGANFAIIQQEIEE